jgi:hypothetical protein
MRRLPDQIKADIGKRQIDLQHRGVSAPFRETLSEDQTVIAQSHCVMEQWIHQMFFTLSGIE